MLLKTLVAENPKIPLNCFLITMIVNPDKFKSIIQKTNYQTKIVFNRKLCLDIASSVKLLEIHIYDLNLKVHISIISVLPVNYGKGTSWFSETFSGLLAFFSF